VLSGYLIPLDLFPAAVQRIALVLPFRFLLSFPVELALGRLSRAHALELLLAQAGYISIALIATHFVWRRGLRRYAAYGG
jgi:ABC-2 type transport system permease protein